MSGEWNPESYEDCYQAAVREVIEQKFKHLPVTPKTPLRAEAQEAVDIIAILQKSLDASSQGREAQIAEYDEGARHAEAARQGGVRTTFALLPSKRRRLRKSELLPLITSAIFWSRCARKRLTEYDQTCRKWQGRLQWQK